MGEGISTSILSNSNVTPPPSPPPPTSTIIPTFVPMVSPTFQKVMQEPITNFFSSQSTEPKVTFMMMKTKMMSLLVL